MPWVMNGDAIAMKDGMPIWKYDDGKESPVDFGSTLTSIRDLTAESVKRKDKIRDMEGQLQVLDGIENPSEWMTKAKEAIKTVQNLSDKQLIDAGEAERMKTSIIEGYEKKLKEKDDVISSKDAGIRGLLVKGAFDGSNFIRESTVLPAGFAYDHFGKNFEVVEEDGELRAVAFRVVNGKKDRIISGKNPSAYASPEEAIEILINEHPDKDRILKGNPGGGGIQPGNGKPLPADLMKLPPAERINAARGIKQ